VRFPQLHRPLFCLKGRAKVVLHVALHEASDRGHGDRKLPSRDLCDRNRNRHSDAPS